MANYDPDTTCFVIAPIGEEGSATRKRSDMVLKHIIRPAAEECGLVALRGDEIDKSGLITHQVVQHIIEDRIVIADLAERNPNVFYELALRHVLRKPYVNLMERGETPPFDLGDVRTIEVDHTDLDSAAECRDKIAKYIKSALESDEPVETPISAATDLMQLRGSGDQAKIDYADIKSELAELRTRIQILPNAVLSSLQMYREYGMMIGSDDPLRPEVRLTVLEHDWERFSRHVLPRVLQKYNIHGSIDHMTPAMEPPNDTVDASDEV